MKQATVSLCLLAILSLVSATNALAACPDPQARLATYINSDAFKDLLDRRELDVDHQRIAFVLLDHRTGDWGVYRMNRGRGDKRKPEDENVEPFAAEDLKKDNVTFTSDGIPETRANGSERVDFALSNTNVALYSLKKVVTREDVPELAKLKQIIAGFAGVAKDIVIRAGVANADLQSFEPIQATELFPQAKLERLQNAAAAIEKTIRKAEDHKLTVISTLQYAEFDQETTPLDLATFAALLQEARKGIDEFRTARDDFRDDPFVKHHSCAAVVAVMKKAKFEGLSFPEKVQHVADLTSELLATSCDIESKSVATAVLEQKDDAAVKIFLTNVTFIETALKWAGDALGQTTDLLKNTASLAQFVAEYKRLNPANEPCELTNGILVADAPDEVLLDKIGIAAITVAERAPLGGTYSRRPNASGDRKFRFAHRATSALAYGVGIIYTPLEDPSYSPIDNPLKADEKVIAKTGEKSRTGDLALLASYRFRRAGSPFRPGIQFGIGITDKTPIFVGGSVDISRYFRFGAGVTAQRVTALQHGYHALRRNSDGTVDPTSISKIGASDKVPTRDKLSTAFYASLVITFDGIPFFEKKD